MNEILLSNSLSLLTIFLTISLSSNYCDGGEFDFEVEETQETEHSNIPTFLPPAASERFYSVCVCVCV